MLKKYSVEYSLRFRKHTPSDHQSFKTDDPVLCADFIQELLETGMGIHAIQRDAVHLPLPEFDRILKVAAAAIAAKRLCASLDISPDEERSRFGFNA